MGTSKRKIAKPPPQLRSRTTRSKGKALSDPAENSQLLTEQLRAMGLYAAPTLGDGNCLFRALSDQLYGTASSHLKLRQDICSWIESHKARYEPFVDDERGLDVHLQCMRQPATYGGHLELSAFAHMTRRNVKVIQPGLVYVIEWAAGGDFSADEPSTSSTPEDSTLNERDKRRLMRDRRRSETEDSAQPESEEDDLPGFIYVAYHDWEHFSSIRSLRGPHTGLPNVVETLDADMSSLPPAPPTRKKPISRAKSKSVTKSALKHPSKSRVSTIAESEAVAPPTPSQIPLPATRSPSPTLESSSLPIPTSVVDLPRDYRSPKRTFDESSASSQALSESSQSAAKRAKSSSRAQSRTRDGEVLPLLVAPQAVYMQVDEVDVDLDTPELSVSGSSRASSSSLSSVPSPAPSPPPAVIPRLPSPEPRLTRRQRKKLNLPKPRAALVGGANARTRTSAGKIVIPGGKSKKFSGKPAVRASGQVDEDPEEGGEWRTNGTGRVDVRGFRELKI
ncbi:cysteine proteinase [Amylocystis lapponica]|nr:cysteine proteinase [Amylocystis lapponica]